MPSDNSKVPGQIFAWFEKMKGNYEKNLTSMMERFERNTDKQNLRIDNQNIAHVESLKVSYNQQLTDKNQTIEHLNKEVNFYKQQLSKQQDIIEQLNGRYDTVMHTLLSEKKQNPELRNVVNNPEIKDSAQVSSPLSIDQDSDNIEYLYNAAIELRRNGEPQDAFILFKKAALLGDVKSMGALARAYFLNEGVEEDQLLGLSWLITAANLNYEPAIKKCEGFKRTSPELYEQSLTLADKL
jgi:TPR repeat protein